ncbi:MAG: lipid-A-disaccharide synthase [Candidatus Omnitrophica bacterium]|nr:lipid-A-disaccharide synthase [Candidatus Omnitrophota bacterium]
MPAKLFIIACEPSGDSHGASLIHELKKIHPGVILEGLGGPQMEKAGVKLLYDMTTISALGLGDVLRQYFKYLGIFNQALARVESWKPDAIVVIDSPAFNLRFAKKIQKKVPLIYYIAPQIWAWGMRRIHAIKKSVTKMLVILPFEKTLYDQAGADSEFVGHPLLDHLHPNQSKESIRERLSLSTSQIAIGLLPGSRSREVERIFPLMLETARHLKTLIPQAVFITQPSANVPTEIFDSILNRYPDIPIQKSALPMQATVSALDFALIASGTATLETALLGTPFFLLYKASWSTYFLGKHLIRVPFLGLVNLLAGRRVVPEFIQNDIKPKKIAEEVNRYLDDRTLYEEMKKDFLEVRKMLGESGASRRAALAVSQFLVVSGKK